MAYDGCLDDNKTRCHRPWRTGYNIASDAMSVGLSVICIWIVIAHFVFYHDGDEWLKKVSECHSLGHSVAVSCIVADLLLFPHICFIVSYQSTCCHALQIKHLHGHLPLKLYSKK